MASQRPGRATMCKNSSSNRGAVPPLAADTGNVASEIVQLAAATILSREPEDKFTALLVKLFDVVEGNTSMMFEILSKPITIVGCDGETLLHLAAKTNLSQLVPDGQARPPMRNYIPRLLIYPQSMCVKNPVGLTPLHHAVCFSE